jgi:hypothetical protein
MKKKINEIDDIIGDIVGAHTAVSKMKPTYSLEIASKFRKGLEGTRFEVKDISSSAYGMTMIVEDTENAQTYNIDIRPARMSK